MAKSVLSKPAPSFSLDDIKIQTAPMPQIAPAKVGPSSHSALHEAVRRMPAGDTGSWFLVPGTAGKSLKSLMGLRGSITRYCKKHNITGVFSALAADGSGLIVRKVAEVGGSPSHPATTKPPQKAIRL